MTKHYIPAEQAVNMTRASIIAELAQKEDLIEHCKNFKPTEIPSMYYRTDPPRKMPLSMIKSWLP